MQIDIPTLITGGTILAAVVASYVRNETNQKQIIKRLDRMNGSIQGNTNKIDHHIETCHIKK